MRISITRSIVIVSKRIFSEKLEANLKSVQEKSEVTKMEAGPHSAVYEHNAEVEARSFASERKHNSNARHKGALT